MLAESALAGMRRSTQTLAPSIQSLLREVGWRPADIQAIGVTIGPGSFTGLRLGAATAKMLSFVTGAAVRGVDTLRVIAAQFRRLCASPAGTLIRHGLDEAQIALDVNGGPNTPAAVLVS